MDKCKHCNKKAVMYQKGRYTHRYYCLNCKEWDTISSNMTHSMPDEFYDMIRYYPEPFSDAEIAETVRNLK